MDGDLPTRRSTTRFFVLVIGLSVPFWILAPFASSVSSLLPMNLPASALMFVCPLVAAMILTKAREPHGHTKELLRRGITRQGIDQRRWYLPAVLLMPGVMLVAYVVMRAADIPLPDSEISLTTVLVVCALYFVAAVAEETGWMGYAGTALQERGNALWAAVVLGSVWAVWHVVPYLQAGHPIGWIAWQCVLTVALRIIIFWLYNNTAGNVLIASLFHASINVGATLYPVNGSAYDPAIVGALIVLAATAICFLWGPDTLREYRYSRVGSHRRT